MTIEKLIVNVGAMEKDKAPGDFI